MTRRRLIAGIACGLVVAPFAAAAQTSTLPRVGFVLTTAPLSTMAGEEPKEIVMRGFVHGLRSLGYVEGKNVVIERRSAEGRLDRLEGLIRELADVPVDVIVVPGPNRFALLTKKITSTVPVVVAGMQTPVELGIVQSLARPGGNITGLVTVITPDFLTKRIEIIRQTLPNASRIAYLGLKEDWDTEGMKGLRATAKRMGLTMTRVEVQMPRIDSMWRSHS